MTIAIKVNLSFLTLCRGGSSRAIIAKHAVLFRKFITCECKWISESDSFVTLTNSLKLLFTKNKPKMFNFFDFQKRSDDCECKQSGFVKDFDQEVIERQRQLPLNTNT